MIKLFLKFLNSFSYAYYYRKNYKIYSIFLYIKLFKRISSGKLNTFPYPSLEVKKFTFKFLNFINAKYGVCVTNGSDAMRVALKCISTKPHDEVIFSSITYHTTASVALELGLKPIFVDCNPKDLSMDLDDLKKKITKKTKAIVIVYLGSSVFKLDKIKEICRKKNIILIEDCAHTHCAKINNKSVGTIGDFGVYSFQQSKLISSGEGGFLIIKKKEDYYKCLSLINCGRKYQKPFNSLGTNLRMTNYQAIILEYKFKKFINKISSINNNINYLNKEISKIRELNPLVYNKNYNSKTAYYYPIIFNKDESKKIDRDKFIKRCNEYGLNFKYKLYDPVYLNPEFGYLDTNLKYSYKKGYCKNTENKVLNNFVWIDYINVCKNKFFLFIILKTIKKILSEAQK